MQDKEDIRTGEESTTQSEQIGNALESRADASTTERINDGSDLIPEDLPGLAIELANGNAFWKLDSGRVELNAFTGNVACRIPKDIDKYDAMTILSGLRIGRIRIADEVKKQEPCTKDPLKFLEERYVRARRLLDVSPISEFKKTISKMTSVKALQTCLEVENSFDRRVDYINAINRRIAELEGAR